MATGGKTTLDLGDAFVELVIWQLPRRLSGSAHRYKYWMPLVREGVCVIRYDNEAGKGDHRHLEGREEPYRFIDLATLIRDFRQAVVEYLA